MDFYLKMVLSPGKGKLRCCGVGPQNHFQLRYAAVSESNESLSHHDAGFGLSESFSSLHINCSK